MAEQMFYAVEHGGLMSYTQISNDILSHIADLQLTPYDVLVYIVLKMHDYGRGYAYPSIRTLSKITGLSLGTVEKSIRRLQAVGLVSIKREGNRNFYSFYQVPLNGKDKSSSTVPDVTNILPQPQMENTTHLRCRDYKGILYEVEISEGEAILTQADKVSSPDQRIFLRVPLHKFLTSFMEIN
jgi:DNA-binding transcriptional ArsR family regulator